MSHVGFPAEGVYRFKNVGTGTFLNLENRIAATGNPVIGFPDDGSPANQWRLVYTDKKDPIFTLQTQVPVSQPLYVQTQNHSVGVGTRAIVDVEVYSLKFGPGLRSSDHFKLQLTGTTEDLVLALADDAEYTPVEVAVDNALDLKQYWIPIQ